MAIFIDDLHKSEIVLDYFISPQGGISHMAYWKIHQPSFDDFPRYKCPFLGELDYGILYYIYIPWVTFGLFFWRFSICTFFFAFIRKKGTKDAKKVHKLNWMGIPCSQAIPRVDSAQLFPCQLVPVDDVQISADCALHCTIKLRINFGELSCLDVNYKSSDIYLWNPWSSLSSDILVIVYSGANITQHLTGV